MEISLAIGEYSIAQALTGHNLMGVSGRERNRGDVNIIFRLKP